MSEQYIEFRIMERQPNDHWMTVYGPTRGPESLRAELRRLREKWVQMEYRVEQRLVTIGAWTGSDDSAPYQPLPGGAS